MALNLELVDACVVEGIDSRDYPDFCDAYVADASYDGEPMTEEELEELNLEYPGFVYERVWEYIH